MDIHSNARLTPLGRERLVRLVESGQTPEAAARAAGQRFSQSATLSALRSGSRSRTRFRSRSQMIVP